MEQLKKVGRPKKPAYRTKRMRFAAVEDALMPVILRLPEGREKDELLLAMEELKKVD